MPYLPNYENKWGTASAWVIQAADRDGATLGPFTGSEILTINLAASQGAQLAVSQSTTWNDFATGAINFGLSAANSSNLTAGQVYQGEVLARAGNGDPKCICWFTLTSLPSAGSGGPILRSLVELDEAINLLGFLGTQQQDMLGQALEAATSALEGYCRRILVLTSFDKLYRPGRTRKIYLHTWPVAIVTGMSWGLDYAGVIANVGGAQIANVSMLPVSTYSNSVTSITLNSTSSGVVATPILLPLSQYPTFGALLAAISGAGNGWQGSAPNSLYNEWPTSRLNYQAGSFGAVQNQVELQIYNTDLMRYNVDVDLGTIEMTQNFPEAFRYADRSFGIGFGWAWSGATEPRNSNVRVIYRAGYAITQADLELGYRPVPAALKTACIYTANSILQGVAMSGPVQSQSVTGRSYTLRSDPSAVPHEARVLLTREINRRFGGWGTK